jgi:uncharacterized protein YegL
MNKDLVEIVFVIDRSGSMFGLENDTIGGFNSFIEKQRTEKGKAFLTTVLFDDQYEILHDDVDLNYVKLLTNNEYYTRGTTALLDAIGKTINNVGNKLSNMSEDDRSSKVLFCIITDGYENASKEFTKEQIKAMIEHQTNKYSWQFIFLGANIDAIAVGHLYGINMAANYSATDQGTRSVYSTLNTVSSTYRSAGGDTAEFKDWDKDIE